jgi:outer membrane protein OmpA-like peptidoglycan-associated protein
MTSPALAHQAPVTPATPVPAGDGARLLQRCGGEVCPAGACDHQEPRSTIARATAATLRPSQVPPIVPPTLRQMQPALELGPVGDRHEQEAERVADLVANGPGIARQPAAAPSRYKISRVQRAGPPADGRTSVSPGLQSRIAAMRGGGRPLPPSVRGYFEPRFGHDFSSVRIHTDQTSGDVVRSVGARAFTVGTDLAFAPGQYAPQTDVGRRLLAHELTHVIQQGGARSAAGVVQRAGDPAAIPAGLACPTDLTATAPAGTDLLFPIGKSAITPAQTTALTTFRDAWVKGGGTDDVIVHGYASTVGTQARNWALSCERAEAVQAELVRLGIPPVRIRVLAHGQTTEFSGSNDPNQRVVVTSKPAGLISLPIVVGRLVPRDNFAGRSPVRFGVTEVIDLGFLSLPPTAAAAFGGLRWNLVSGGGTLAGVTPDGTATYTAPAAAGAVTLELRVAAGATAGRVVSSHTIAIVIPNGVRMVAVPGTAPGFMPAGAIPVGTWGAGFRADVFIDPKDVSFLGVFFGEGTIAAAVTGSFLAPFAGLMHPVNTFGPAHGGNAVTGTAVSPPRDGIFSGTLAPKTLLGLRFCGGSDFLWAIPWEFFFVAGGPRTPFATANHHVTSTFSCNATIEKGGAGPFCRKIDGTPC